MTNEEIAFATELDKIIGRLLNANNLLASGNEAAAQIEVESLKNYTQYVLGSVVGKQMNTLQFAGKAEIIYDSLASLTMRLSETKESWKDKLILLIKGAITAVLTYLSLPIPVSLKITTNAPQTLIGSSIEMKK